jgi:hypothetical protein
LIQTLQGRLRKPGIPSTRTARNGAWLALVGSVHWKMLADLLGVADGTAGAWQRKWRRPRQLRCRPPAATTPAVEPDLTALNTRCHP